MLPITMFKNQLLSAVLIFCCVLLQAGPARADMYQRCVALSEQDPDAAFDLALEWEASDLTGGAFHCAGLALTALGLFDAAAGRFQQAAHHGQNMNDVQRAMLYQQSGEAWLLAGRGDEAVAAFSKALGFAPQNPSYLYARARGLELIEKPDEALVDVNAAITFDPTNSLAYLLRARLERQVGQLADAARDIETAITMRIDMVPAQLERGLIRFEQDDREGALEDWRAVIAADVEPDGTPGFASKTASRFIEELGLQAETAR